MRTTFVLLTVAGIAGCAMTYEPPVAPAPRMNVPSSAPIAAKMKAARQALVAEGYQITAADEASGTISTAPRNLRVSPEDANCGTTAGIDYLKDPRTSTRVSIGIIASGGALEVKANIEGEYKPGDVVQDIVLTCVSKGTIERALLSRIQSAIGR